MRDKKFREARSHATYADGVVPARAFLFGNHPASRLWLRGIS
jgi:hypothetical protein